MPGAGVPTLAAAHALVLPQIRAHIGRLTAWRQYTGLDAEDLAQEAWVIVGRLLATYDPATGDLAHYLRASLPWALRRQVEHASPRRTQRATAPTPVVVQGQSATWWQGAALYRGAWDADETALAEALAGLPPLERAVVAWHVEDGLPFRAIAARLGRRPATIWAAWQRAAARLREYYREEG